MSNDAVRISFTDTVTDVYSTVRWGPLVIRGVSLVGVSQPEGGYTVTRYSYFTVCTRLVVTRKPNAKRGYVV